MRPPELVVADRKQHLCAREGDERVARIRSERCAEHPEHLPSDVVAQRGGRIGTQAGLGRDSAYPLLPELGGGDRPPAQGAFRNMVAAALERKIATACPRIQQLQREERVAAALLPRALDGGPG